MSVIYIVEDDDDIREMVIYALSSVGFASEGFAEGAPFWARLKEALPSLVLLDIMLPSDDGLSIVKQIRQTEKTKNLPVIMLTAKGSEFDRVKGLDLGADDYITKPFSVMELISRTRAVLRRCGGGETEAGLRVGDIALDAEKRTVCVGAQDVALTYKEFELLHYMMINEGIVLSRSRLLEQVWGFDYGGESRTVDMHIKSLRQKLGEAGALIKTIRHVGYKMGE